MNTLLQVLNPLDAVCNRPRTDAICINQLKNAKPIDKGLLQERPDVKIFLPFRFLFYRPEELFQAHQYNRYLGNPNPNNGILHPSSNRVYVRLFYSRTERRRSCDQFS